MTNEDTMADVQLAARGAVVAFTGLERFGEYADTIDELMVRAYELGRARGDWQIDQMKPDILRLINYSWSDESADYAENPDPGHILLTMHRLLAAIDSPSPDEARL